MKGAGFCINEYASAVCKSYNDTFIFDSTLATNKKEFIMAAQNQSAKVLSGAGLRGQVAGKTALSTVGKSGSGLTYRGYDVSELAEKCIFE